MYFFAYYRYYTWPARFYHSVCGTKRLILKYDQLFMRNVYNLVYYRHYSNLCDFLLSIIKNNKIRG